MRGCRVICRSSRRKPDCGTAGFLVEAYEHLKARCQPKDWEILQSSLSGIEAKPLPFMLAQMNLLLHGVEYPDVERKNSLPTAILPEKHRIVAYLDNLQAKVEALKRLQNETATELDALLPSILDKAFKG
jgi:type I restriction enzyme M protein